MVALAAHQCGMTVFAFSLISNECILSDDVEEGPTAEEVIESGERRDGACARDSRHFRKLIQYRDTLGNSLILFSLYL